MAKVKRQIITIDEEKCDGCGNCVPACVEGALQVIDGKARLVKQSYCDGLGACLGDCPQDALHVTTLEVEAYDEPAVLGYLQQTAPEAVERHVEHLARAWDAVIVRAGGQSAAGRHPALPFGADAGVGRRTDDEGRTGAKPCQVGVAPVARAAPSGAHAGALLPGHEPHPGRRLCAVRQPQHARRPPARFRDCGGLPEAGRRPGLYQQSGTNPAEQRHPQLEGRLHGGALLPRPGLHRPAGPGAQRQGYSV